MQHCPKVVSCYIKTLENGYEQTTGSVFCEVFNFFWFKILGLMPGYDTCLNYCMAEVFGAPFEREIQPNEPGLKDPFYRHALGLFKPLFC